MTLKRKPRQLTSTIKFKVLQAVVDHWPCTYHRVTSVVIAKGSRSVLNALNELHREKKIHIANWVWTDNFQHCMAQYAPGPGIDALRPYRTTEEKREVQRQSRERQKQKRDSGLRFAVNANSVFNLGRR